MPGLILEIQTTVGSEVKKDEPLMILEAMKMQHEIRADIDGIIENINLDEGSQVSTGDLLLKILPKP